MGREVRQVPADWQHPQEWYKGELSFKPLLCRSILNYWSEADEEPKPEDDAMMPAWTTEEATHYQMYENTSEGTPISPVLATPEELARWLTDNDASAFGHQTASYEGWLRVAQGGYAPTMIVDTDGLHSGVDGLK